VRCYPAAWRARYGEEFVELLVDDIAERRSWSWRTVDVVRSGCLTRMAYAGLAGDPLEPREQIRAGLAAVGCALAGFLVLGIAIWSQLTIGWQWSAPADPATAAAMVVMSGAVACRSGSRRSRPCRSPGPSCGARPGASTTVSSDRSSRP
jgi:hypothetical protein